jgi:hypothetical protein
MKFFLDENFPRAAAELLGVRGHECIDIRGTEKEGSEDAAIFSMKPFTTSRKSPNVTSVRGNVSTRATGLTSAFTSPSTRAATTADVASSRSKFLTRLATSRSSAAVTRMCARNTIMATF